MTNLFYAIILASLVSFIFGLTVGAKLSHNTHQEVCQVD